MLFKSLRHWGAPIYAETSERWSLPENGQPGEWMPPRDVNMCRSGYHLTTLEHLPCWIGADIYVAEGRGAYQIGDNKIVFEQARLTKRLRWDWRKAALFAADCAEHVLPIYEAACPGDDRPRKCIEAVRLYVAGKITREQLVQARDASAAYAAANAGDAAYAAYAAAYAGDAAYAAAYAGDAAANVISDTDDAYVARQNERRWQAKRLAWYLGLSTESEG